MSGSAGREPDVADPAAARQIFSYAPRGPAPGRIHCRQSQRGGLHIPAKGYSISGMTSFGISMGGVALRHPECRQCNAPLTTTTSVDPDMSPLCQSMLAADQIDQTPPFFSRRLLLPNSVA